MPRTAFPLSKSHSYQLGSTWEWCVWRLSCDTGCEYRLLVAFDPSKQQYRAWLGMQSGSDQALLARLEYHPSHKGWHCHIKCGLVSDIVLGVVKEPRSKDKSRNCNAADIFDISQMNAIGVALRVFNASLPDKPWGIFS
jgi:hypothetical protein